MPELWIALTGFIMLFLFWRQIMIFKLRQKINYAPLIVIVGLVSSISLFVFSAESEALKTDIEYALMPLLISLIFYMPMYLMHQIRINDTKLVEEENEKQLRTFLSYIQEYFTVLDDKLSNIQSNEMKTLDAVQMTMKNELSVFSRLSSGQEMLSAKIEAMHSHEETALSKIHEFLGKDMHDLDTVVHRHIDILRIAEQDHFNKTNAVLNNMYEHSGNKELLEIVSLMAAKFENLESSMNANASELVNGVQDQLKQALKSINTELKDTKQLSETLHLSTQEYEMKLEQLHKQASLLLQKSDIIHESMEDTYTQTQKVRPIYASLNDLIGRLMDIYAEYKQAKKELQILAADLGKAEERHFDQMDKKLDDLGIDIHDKIEQSLRELQAHYHIADKEVSNTVKTLAAKAQLHKSYSEE
ncbi:MAG TPA: hypothetical protein EYO73_09260 [Sulfurimonas sp.]|nr:hypothetical protein [Sulfurimonas sp.]